MKSTVNDFIRQKNKLGEAITPIYLYSIQYDAITNSWVRWTSFKSNITYDGNLYNKQVIKHDGFKENTSGMIDKIRLIIGNAEREIQYYLDNYDGLKECTCLITMVWLENLDNADCKVEHEFLIESATSDESFGNLVLSATLDVLDIHLPRRLFSRHRCQYAEFKNSDCGYSGVGDSCDRTYDTCDAYGNIARFGAFPGVPMSFPKQGL